MRLSIYADAYHRSFFRGVYLLQEKGEIAHIDAIGLRGLVERPYKFLRMLRYIKADKLILFAAPYNPLAYYFLFLKRVKRPDSMIYLTSWPYWEEDKYRWAPYTPFIRAVWNRFLDNVKVVALTEKARKGVEERGARAYHIPHSVDTQIFQPRKGKREGAVKILYVGRMVPQKGILYLLNIAGEMSNRDVEFWFVGEGPLREEVQRAGQNCRIRYFGHIGSTERLAQIYSQADIFVLPSYESGKWAELFGVVLIEAMASGLPVVATDCIGPKEIIEQGKNGYIVPQRDEKALKGKLEILIDDEELRDEMGNYGRKLAEEKYDVEKVSEMWWRVLVD